MKINAVRVKTLTICYVVLLAVIILIADRKSTGYLLNFIGNIPYGDKIGHFLLMGVLSFLVNLSLEGRSVQLWKLRYPVGTALVLAVVTVEEFSQLFIGGRTFDWGDLIADCAGIIILGETARCIHQKVSAQNAVREEI